MPIPSRADAALNSIDFAISELSVKNLYIIGHISCIEGYKLAIRRGYGLTLRQTVPDVVEANLSLRSELFETLASFTEQKWGTGDMSAVRRERLRKATMRCLKEAWELVLEPGARLSNTRESQWRSGEPST
jgi:carbonic anhydrase